MAQQLLIFILISIFTFKEKFFKAEIIRNSKGEDFCASNPCGDGNTCFNTPIGHKCFCHAEDGSNNCMEEEKCMLFNHTGVCRHDCMSEEYGFFVVHLGGKYMEIKIYNQESNQTLQERVPVGDINEQVPCMWQLSGKPNCCVQKEELKIGCFAYGSKVKTENRGTLAIEHVRTGDRVEAIDHLGQLTFSDVIMIMHQEPERTETMVSIVTPSGNLSLTADHLVLASLDGITWNYLFSEKVIPGSWIKMSDGSSVQNVRVLDIVRLTKKGLYAPVTEHGTIVVDGVVSSCYGNHPDHRLSHSVFSPIRLAYSLRHWINLYDGDAVAEDGSHPYVSFLNKYLRALTGHALTLSQYRLDQQTTYM